MKRNVELQDDARDALQSLVARRLGLETTEQRHQSIGLMAISRAATVDHMGHDAALQGSPPCLRSECCVVADLERRAEGRCQRLG